MLLSQTTLGELYASLSPEEIKRLELYLQKNTVGKQNTLLALHRYLCQAKQAKQLDKLETEDIKSELFGGDRKSVSKLTTYNNLLTNHIKDYLLLSKIHEKNIYTETLWGEILIERSLKRNLLLKLTNFKLDIYKDSYALMKKFFHDRERFHFEYLNLTKRNYRQMIESLDYQIESFYNYTRYSLIEYFSGYVSLSKQINISNDKHAKEINALIEEGRNSVIDLVKIHSLMLSLMIDNCEASYKELVEIFKEKIWNISDETNIQIYPVLINYGTKKINKGQEEFDIQNYQIFSVVSKADLLFKQGFFSVVRLFAFIRLELRYGTIAKAELLLEESLKVISPVQKDSFQYLIESRIAFAKKDYKLSLRKISIINPSDSIYYFPQYKIMLIKNYIMLADIDRLMAERENFYKYLNNQKNIQEDEKRRHKLFIKYTEYLTNARYEYLTDYMKKRIENALLQTSPYFSEKQWVRERWEELKSVGSGQ